MTLKLTSFANPRNPHRVAVFRQTDHALDHIRDHLLTAPECDAWALIHSGLSTIIPQDPKQRWKLYESAVQSRGTSVQELYDDFAALIEEASSVSSALNWWVQQGTVTAGLSKLGVLVLLDFNEPGAAVPEVVRTAFLPGQGSREKTRESKNRPAEGTGLMREGASRGMRNGARRKWTRKGSEARRQAARRTRWSVEQRIFFDVFRPAVQTIRDSYWDSNARRARKRGTEQHEYALLKKELPPNSELGFDDWREL